MSASVERAEREDLWGYAKRLRFVREAIRDWFPQSPTRTLRVLDVGCGNGSQLALPLARRADELHLTGIDTDLRSIEHARQLAEDTDNARFLCGRVEDLPLAEPFDVVILSEVLEHLKRPEELLAASARVMDRNGIMIVTVPNGYGEFEIDSWMFRKLGLQRVVDKLARNRNEPLGSTDNHESGHIQFFTRSRLKALFTACGLVPFKEGAGSLLAGPIVGHVVARSTRLIDWNARITNRLPFQLASAWYFALRRAECGPRDAVGDGV